MLPENCAAGRPGPDFAVLRRENDDFGKKPRKNLLTGRAAIAISPPTVNADNDGRRFGASPGFPFPESFLYGTADGVELSTSREVWPEHTRSGGGYLSLFLIVGFMKGHVDGGPTPRASRPGVVVSSSSICLNAYACGGRSKDWFSNKVSRRCAEMSSLKRASVRTFLRVVVRK